MKIDIIKIPGAPELYYGWPANHGHWQWGDEMLFGAVVGERDPSAFGMHKVSGKIQKMLFRSKDGGESWSGTFPNVDFEGIDPQHIPEALVERRLADTALRFCGFYDHGGEACAPSGAFYTSEDKGYTWSGPFLIEGMDLTSEGKTVSTTRTCHLGDLVFFSKAHKGMFGSDRVVVGRLGVFPSFFCTQIAELPDPAGARQVMPAAVQLDNGLIIVLCRRKQGRAGWITAYVSDDGGRSWWIRNETVAVTGERNGNPPALLARGDRLFAAFGNRSSESMMLAVSENAGSTWRQHTIKQVGCYDFGYPRLFLRSDGALVCVYYVEGVLEAAIIREV